MNILFLAAEADPLIKVGGLGDVAGSLPEAIRNLSRDGLSNTDFDVRLVIPFHPAIDPSPYSPELVGELSVPNTAGVSTAEVYAINVKGVPVYLIKSNLFQPGMPVYSIDTRQDGRKYAFFSLAALELAKLLDWQPDILHANDWHTATAIYALAIQRRSDPFFSQTHSVLSIHNLPFMGRGSEEGLAFFNLPPSDDDRLPDWSRYFPLAMGLSIADKIVAVSPSYAQEILTPEFGCNLQDFLNLRSGAVTGILNGLDMTQWDPATDRWLPQKYTSQELALRAVNKKALQKNFGLSQESELPLLAIVSRMDQQKGIDLALAGLRLAVERPWQAIILGTGDPTLEAAARKLEEDYPDRVKAAIRFDSALSHLFYGGADMLMMPSRYEPCGLAQMIAMRYGSIPIARATGGLRDTIQDHQPRRTGTGFLFQMAQAAAFSEALNRALDIYAQPKKWKAIQQKGMSLDFSWQQSALGYSRLYQGLQG